MGRLMEPHFTMYYEELKHERYDDVLYMTRWSKNALPHVAKHHKDWEQNKRSLIKEAKWHKTPFVRQGVGKHKSCGFLTIWYCGG